jgi:hypothetical protein
LAVVISGIKDTEHLIVYYQDQILKIPRKYFKMNATIDNLKKYLPQEVFSSEAVNNAPKYLELRKEWLVRMNTINSATEFSKGATEVYIVFYFLLSGLAYFFVTDNGIHHTYFNYISILLLVIALVIIFTSIGKIKITSNEIIYQKSFRKISLAWADIQKVYFDPNYPLITIITEENQITLGYFSFTSRTWGKLLDTVCYKLELFNIQPVENPEINYWLKIIIK